MVCLGESRVQASALQYHVPQELYACHDILFFNWCDINIPALFPYAFWLLFGVNRIKTNVIILFLPTVFELSSKDMCEVRVF